MRKILGDSLMEKDGSRIDESLFEVGRGDDLADSILKSFADSTTTTDAIAAADVAEDDDPDEKNE